MSSARNPHWRPMRLARDGQDRLVIEWNDGHRSMYSWTHLRASCPCASCREESGRPADPFRILTPGELAPRPPLAPVEFTPVGLYAYKIKWNDGHDSGIYTLEALRALCQCPRCERAHATSSQEGQS
jgi:YD repeat-containing protein